MVLRRQELKWEKFLCFQTTWRKLHAHEVKQFFDEDLVLNDELVELKHEINSSHLKMARVPSSVKLAFGKDPSGKPSCFPLISALNAFLGVPQFLEKSFSLLEDILLISNREKRFLL